MSKWSVIIALIYGVIGFSVWKFSYYKPISEQIDLKTMTFTNPSYLFHKTSQCDGICENNSSSSSWGGGSFGGK